MNSWKTVPLEEVADVFNGKTPSKAEQRSEGHPVLKIKDVSELGEYRGKFESFVEPALAEKFAQKQVREGDTLILNAAHNADYVGSKTYRAQCPTFGALATGEWLIIRPAENALHPHFAHHWVNNAATRHAIRNIVNGIHLYPKDVARLRIPLPPLAEQRRIAGILDKAEALRAKRRAALAKIDTLPQAIFLELFGDPFINPRRWPVFALSEISEATQGVQIPRDAQREEAAEGYERYLYINDFYSDDNPKYVENRYPTKRVTADNLIMANTGSPGRVFKGRPGILSNNLFKITFDTQQISTVFFYHFLASHFFQQHLQAQMKQGIQRHLGHKIFGAQKLPLPPIELQREFARRVLAVEKLKAAQRASLAKLDALFASLQHRGFRGEL